MYKYDFRKEEKENVEERLHMREQVPEDLFPSDFFILPCQMSRDCKSKKMNYYSWRLLE